MNVQYVKKRTGRVVPYDRRFIERAIQLAANSAGEYEEAYIEATLRRVEEQLAKRTDATIAIEEIQDLVERSLFEEGHFETAKAYILYRVDKERSRSQTDRRRVTVSLTPRAEGALAYHAAFHRQLIGAVSAALGQQQLETLGDALRTLHTFFKGYAPGGIV